MKRPMLQINMQILQQAISSYHLAIFIGVCTALLSCFRTRNAEDLDKFFFYTLWTPCETWYPSAPPPSAIEQSQRSHSSFALFAVYLEFSIGTAFRSLTKAPLTACTLLLSLAFLLATTWGGFSLCGTCLYLELFSFFSRSGRSAAETRSNVQGYIFFSVVEEGLVPHCEEPSAIICFNSPHTPGGGGGVVFNFLTKFSCI